MTAPAPTRPAVRARRVPLAVVAAIGAAWLVILTAEFGGFAVHVHHDELADGGLPAPAALVVFLVAWQVMVAAMMVPSTWPLLRLFRASAQGQPRPGHAIGALLAGYGLVWGAFGAVAFAGDLFLHEVAHSWPWLDERPWLIAGSVLLLAGGFQFSDLKDRCLSECRQPGLFLLQHYRHGVRAAYDLGRRHGMSCLGCCWALMLVMFAAGTAALWWMVVLGTLMAYEKIGRHGQRVSRVAGVVFLALGGAVLLQAGSLAILASG